MNSAHFQGQVALITGAGAGIGREIARRLALQGACILLNDIEEEVALDAATTIQAEGGNCECVVGDASEPSLIAQLVQASVSTFGRLDMVVANAGITTFGHFLDYSPAQFERLIAVNLRGSFFLAQAAAKQMILQGSRGRMLFMSSVTGVQAHPQLVAYGMTKAALQMLAKGLAVELAPHGLTVNALAPGATLTERTLALDPDYEQVWKSLTPMGRVSTTEDIAQAALFLLSPLSQQITGQTLVIDGGWTALSPPPSQM